MSRLLRNSLVIGSRAGLLRSGQYPMEYRSKLFKNLPPSDKPLDMNTDFYVPCPVAPEPVVDLHPGVKSAHAAKALLMAFGALFCLYQLAGILTPTAPASRRPYPKVPAEIVDQAIAERAAESKEFKKIAIRLKMMEDDQK